MTESDAVNGQASWQELVAVKQEQCDKKIPVEWRLREKQLAHASQNVRLLETDVPRHSGILSEAELDITEAYSASDLLRKLSTGQVGSVEVTTAFCKRGAIAQQLVSDSRELEDRFLIPRPRA